MKQKKKSGFFTFLCSFIPGAAEMYMGFMKMGASLMALFLLVIVIGFMLGMEELLLSTFGVLIWFYSFFHARNLVSCDTEDFMKVADVPVWEELELNEVSKKSSFLNRKWMAIGMIIIGCLLLWNNLKTVIYSLIPKQYWNEIYQYVGKLLDSLPKIVIAVIIIWIGIRLITGKKEELNGESESNQNS